jgi:hypothetical protein
MYKNYSDVEIFNNEIVTIFLEDARWHPILKEWQYRVEHTVAPS